MNRIAAALAVSSASLMSSATHAAPLPMLHAEGAKLVDAASQPVILRGCNLGNYLILEGWMFGGTLQQNGKGLKDGVTFQRKLVERFGEEKTQRLIELYRENWITQRDFEQIKSFGFNVVRLPFDYRTLQSDEPPYAIKPDAFRWLDHAVDMAEAAGLYTILDLHGAPGGQSIHDHTGESGQNKFWDSPEHQQRAVALWKAIAEHFRDRASVAAYDLMNEPYSDHKQDVRPVLSSIMPEITRAIRATGDEHVVYFPGIIGGGIDFYADPRKQGLTNVAFTEHFYPGLFGSKPALETQARTLYVKLPATQKFLVTAGYPYLVGEFNVVLAAQGSDRVMRAYYDRFAEYGWQGTMWSYKLLSKAGGTGPSVWHLVTNAEPLNTIDIDTCAYEDLERFFMSFATMPLVAKESLKTALTTTDPGPLFLTRTPTTSPSDFKTPEDGEQSKSLVTRPLTAWNEVGEKAAITRGQEVALAVTQAPAGLSYEIAAKAGDRYRFSVDVHVADVDTAVGAQQSVELRLESTGANGALTLNYHRFKLTELASTPTRLTISGTAAGENVRAIVVTHSDQKVDGTSRVRIDDPMLTCSQPKQ